MLLAVDNVKSISQFLTLVVIFIIVLAITYFTTRFIANYQKCKMSDSNIKLIEAIRINQNKYIQLVQIGKKYYALAVSKDNVSVIAEVPEEELVLSEDSGVVPHKFSDILASFKKNDENEERNETETNEEE